MINELDIVALAVDLPEHGLKEGDTGTVVFVHEPGQYEVEFITLQGDTIALLPLSEEQVRPVAPGEVPHARLVELQR